MFITSKCICCEQCISACPVSAISIEKGGKKAVIDQNICIKCGYCVNICPVQAITEEEPKNEGK